MRSSSLLTLASALLLSMVASVAFARITSIGLETAAGTRAALDAKDFKIIPAQGTINRQANFTARIANLNTFPALAGVDVQTQFVLTTIKPQRDFIPHYHPRGAEFFFVISGNIRVRIMEEGGRILENILRPGEATVFPTGLGHLASCVSKTRACNFVATFNTADPGLVPIPSF